MFWEEGHRPPSHPANKVFWIGLDSEAFASAAA